MVQVTLSITGANPSDIQKAMAAWAAQNQVTSTPTETAPKTATKKTAKVEAAEEETFDLGDDETETEEAAATETEYSYEDVVLAFGAYAKKTTRDKAIAVLKKFKVKGVKDLDTDQYPAVMKALGA